MLTQTNKIRRVLAVIAGGALMMFAFGAHADSKVVVCHGTGSETNSLIVLDINENAVDAHLEHGDTLFDAEEGCGGGGGGPDPV